MENVRTQPEIESTTKKWKRRSKNFEVNFYDIAKDLPVTMTIEQALKTYPPAKQQIRAGIASIGPGYVMTEVQSVENDKNEDPPEEENSSDISSIESSTSSESGSSSEKETDTEESSEKENDNREQVNINHIGNLNDSRYSSDDECTHGKAEIKDDDSKPKNESPTSNWDDPGWPTIKPWAEAGVHKKNSNWNTEPNPHYEPAPPTTERPPSLQRSADNLRKDPCQHKESWPAEVQKQEDNQPLESSPTPEGWSEEKENDYSSPLTEPWRDTCTHNVPIDEESVCYECVAYTKTKYNWETAKLDEDEFKQTESQNQKNATHPEESPALEEQLLDDHPASEWWLDKCIRDFPIDGFSNCDDCALRPRTKENHELNLPELRDKKAPVPSATDWQNFADADETYWEVENQGTEPPKSEEPPPENLLPHEGWLIVDRTKPSTDAYNDIRFDETPHNEQPSGNERILYEWPDDKQPKSPIKNQSNNKTHLEKWPFDKGQIDNKNSTDEWSSETENEHSANEWPPGAQHHYSTETWFGPLIHDFPTDKTREYFIEERAMLEEEKQTVREVNEQRRKTFNRKKPRKNQRQHPYTGATYDLSNDNEEPLRTLKEWV